MRLDYLELDVTESWLWPVPNYLRGQRKLASGKALGSAGHVVVALRDIEMEETLFNGPANYRRQLTMLCNTCKMVSE